MYIRERVSYAGLKQYLPLLQDRSIGMLLAEKWNWALFRELKKARRYAGLIDGENVKRVFIFSYSRGGSHNFASRFHYLPCAFCFREQAFEREDDPFQFQVRSSALNSLHFLLLSMFSRHGLQDKDGSALSHLFLINNRYLEHESRLGLSGFCPTRDSMIFYIRNIFRVLYSRDKSGSRIGKAKPRFELNDDRFEFALRQHRRKLSEFLSLQQAMPDSVKFCIHEHFCADPDHVLAGMFEFLGIPVNMRNSWDQPEAFFARCFGDRERPVIKDGKLWCQKRNEYIQGTGGKFNPLQRPNLSRTMNDEISTIMTPARYRLAVSIFGEEITNFWLNDKKLAYSTHDANSIMTLIEKLEPVS
jgi:hypothetical protein